MSLPGNGIFVVKGEMSILLTAMRRGNSRWSSHHQDDEDPLTKAFHELKDLLNGFEDLRLVEPLDFLNPFLEVIRSEDTTGPVTSLALSAVNKFLSYGLIDPTHTSIPLTVHSIADAVNHARFVGTDQSSDGVVLMKILQVLKTLILSPEGASLTNESLCDIMLSCFKICFETRLSDLLRRTAEHYLKDMIQLVFMRLPQFPEVLMGNFKQLKMRPGSMEQGRTRKKSKSIHKVKQKPVDSKFLEKNGDNEDQTSLPVKTNNSLRPNHLSTTPITPAGNIVDMQGSISQTPQQFNLDGGQFASPSTPLNEKQDLLPDGTIPQITVNFQTPDGTDAAANNMDIDENISLEKMRLLDNSPDTISQASTVTLHSENIVMDLQEPESSTQDYVNQRGIRFTPQHPDDMSFMPYGLPCVYELFRFLISLCNPLDKQNTDVMIHLGLTLLTTAFEVGADSIGKYSCMLTLVKDELCRNLFSLLSTERLSVFAAVLQVSFLMIEALRTHLKFQLEFYLSKLMEIITSDSPKMSYEYKELALDNILNMWRIPGFTTELYLNYDCNMYCTNLYEDLTELLAKNIFPVGVYHTHLLSLDALLTVVDSVEAHCNEKDCEVQNEKNREQSEEGIENIQNIIGRGNRMKVSEKIPTREELCAIKNIKKWLPTGTEYFNQKPKKGIQFLQEHGVLKQELDTHEICVFLRENPGLDKTMIGEYLSGRNNLQVLETFVQMFDFNDIRIDEALRSYLETFRLPGEAPLISLLLENFAEHWHKCNGEPFANADAAFTLAYAVIMLNVDQHNHNAKKQNIPMTPEEFKKNLKKVNGGNDFDQDMLDEIYTSIRNDEIVMPAEQTGIVRENYLWKVLLRRGASKDGAYTHVSSGSYDIDLFSLIWGPIVSALSFVFDKSDDISICRKALQGFEKCAAISSHFGMTDKLDILMATLSKYTMLNSQPKQNNLTVLFGANVKAQLALKTMFQLAHQHGDNIRAGWKNLFDLVLTLYTLNLLPKSFTEAEDFIEASGKIALIYEGVQIQKQESSLLSSLYSYMVSSENISRVPTPEEQELIQQTKTCIAESGLEQIVTDSKFLHDESLLDLINALVQLSRGPDVEKSLGYTYNENITVFFLELLIKVVLQNRDRVLKIWQNVRDHLYTLTMNASHFDYQFLLERSVIGLLRLAIRLMRNEDMSQVVLQSLRMLLLLKASTLYRISRQISFGLYELLKTSAQNIHTRTDWSIVFTLLECVGAGAQPPKPVLDEGQADQGAKSEGEGPASSGEEDISPDRGYTSDSELTKSPRHTASEVRSQSPIIMPVSPTPPNNAGGWILVGNEGEVQPIVGRTPPAHQYSLALERNLGPHDPVGLVKCCESLTFLVRDVAHITPYNFDECVHCIRTFVEASLHESKRSRRISGRDSRGRRKNAMRRRTDHRHHQSPVTSPEEEDESDDELPGAYHQVTIQLLDLMHTLHTRTGQIFHWWAEEGGEVAKETSLWAQGWCPLLQGIARLCCDSRKQVRMNAITYLQRALLVHDLQTLTGPEWEACFNRVLFPLLNQLLQPIGNRDPSAMEETRMRAATVLSKVFLHHLTPLLSLDTFSQLWLTILEYMDKYMHADKSDLLAEAIPESLKNILLVMESAGVFERPGELWTLTWNRMATFLPNMKDDLFKESAEVVEETTLLPQPPPLEQTVGEYPKSTIQVTQHNVENATKSSIILQPPTPQNTINSPLFAHLGQMVSTPIGPPIVEPHIQTTSPTNTTLSSAFQMSQQQVPIAGATQNHTFPVLYSVPSYTAPLEIQPASLYTDYMVNPYNSPVSDNTFPSNGRPEGAHPNQPVNPILADVLNTNLPAAVSNQEPDPNSNCDQAVFQSANYFCSDQKQPPGSEMLFGGSQVFATNFNIPTQTNPVGN